MRIRLTLAVFFIFAFYTSVANAVVDLIVNINDTGFDPSIAGQQITYPIRVSNNGNDDAINVILNVTLPATVNFVSAVGTGVSCAAPVGSALNCDFGDLSGVGNGGDEERTVNLVVATTVQQLLTLTASASASAIDPIPGNNINQTEQTTVDNGADVDLAINGTASVQSGDVYNYSYVLTNNGPGDATAQRITAPIPSGFGVISVPAGCVQSGANIICDVAGPVTSGNSVTLTPVVGTVFAASASTLTASASVALSPSAPGTALEDPTTTNNTSTFNTMVTSGTDMMITVERSVSGNVLVGSGFNFDVTPTYSGEAPNNVTVTVMIPGEYVIGVVPPSQNGWACSVSLQIVSCTQAGGGAVGLAVSLGDISIPVTANSAATNVTTTATIASSSAPSEVNPANNTDDDGGVDLLAPAIDLDMIKNGPSPALAVVGVPFDYRFFVPNTGNSVYTGDLRIIDSVPAGLTYNSVTTANGWTCDAGPVVGPNTVTCTRAGVSIGVGAQHTGPVLNFTATSAAAHTNSAQIIADTCSLATCNDGDTGNGVVTASTGPNSTDVSILKTVDLDPVPAGDVLTYTLEIVNADITATDVLITDALTDLINNSAGATGAGFISAVFNANGSATVFDSCNDTAGSNRSRNLSCTLTSLPVCTQGVDCPTITIQVRPDDPTGTGGNRSNAATALSQNVADPTVSNNTTSINSSVVPRADVTVTLSDTPDPVAAGQNLTYVITASNAGPSRADTVTVTQTLPLNVVFVSAVPSTGSCATLPVADSIISGGTNHISCDLGNINDGGQQTVTVIVRPLLVTRGTQLASSSTVSTTTTETNNLTNTAATTTDVNNPIIDLLVNISEDVDPVAVGDLVTYTITGLNNGPSATEGTDLIITLPDEGRLNFQSIAANGASCTGVPSVGDVSGATITCDLGYLEDGESHSVDIVMLGISKGTAVLDTVVQSDDTIAGFDSNNANNVSDENTTVRTKADVEVLSKVAQSLVGAPISSIELRENFRFFIQLINNTGAGLAEADDVVLSDNLPTGMELTGTPTATVTSGSTTLNSCTGAAGSTSFTCSFGTVSSGATLDIIVPVQIISATALMVDNIASVVTSSLDTVPSNNMATGSIPAGGVQSSSIAGRVYRDNNNNAAINAGETGIAGVTLQLSGNSFDSLPISDSVTTDSNGDYVFAGLPESDASGYTITQQVFSDPDISDGQETLGSEGGTLPANDQITVVLNANADATGYLFGELPIPRIGLAKRAGPVIATSGGRYSVDYTLRIENAGATTLDDVQVVDSLSAFGVYTSSTTPAAGEYTISTAPSISLTSNSAALVPNAAYTGAGAQTNLFVSASSSLPEFDRANTAPANEASVAEVSFTVEFFPAATVYDNTAQASATDPVAVVVNDDSVDGSNIDPNANDDPTDDDSVTRITIGAQEIEITKTLGSVVQTSGDSFNITYQMLVSNPSVAITASRVQVVDDLLLSFPGVAPSDVSIPTPPQVSACSGTVLVVDNTYTGVGQNDLLAGNQDLQPGESCVITIITAVDFNAALPAVQTNTAIATTSTAADVEVDREQDSADIRFDNLASVEGEIWRDNNHNAVNDGEPAVPGFIVEVLNAAGDLLATSMTDSNGDYSIAGLYPSTLGDNNTFYTVQFRDPDSMAVYGTPLSTDPGNPNGTPQGGQILLLQLNAGVNTTDQSLPLDPAGVIYDSIVRQPIAGAQISISGPAGFDPAIHLVGGIGNATQTTGPSGMYQFLLLPGAPNGDYSLQVADLAGYLPGNSVFIPPCTNTLSVGNTPLPNLLVQVSNDAPTGSVALHDPNACPADSATLGANNNATQYYLTFNLTNGVSVDVLNNHIPLDPITDGALTLVKSTPKVNVKRAELVPYTITARNNFSATIPNIDVIDQLPGGFQYIEGSATLDGEDAQQACSPLQIDQSTRQLRCHGLSFSANAERKLQLILVPGAGVSEGEYVNIAWAENSLVNLSVSNRATAVVRIVPDPIFDCSDVIGKVFDDANHNGHQDDGEEALPNIRLATVRGLLVTTDEHGRYHIACSAVPNQDRGSNFIIKLDERSLPSGYRVTTENPRVVRLTRGKVEEANFGATIHRVVRVDIDDSVFEADSADLVEGYQTYIQTLIDQLNAGASTLRIAYVAVDESQSLVKKRIKHVRKILNKKWREEGCCYHLDIEHEITRVPLSEHQRNQFSTQGGQ